MLEDFQKLNVPLPVFRHLPDAERRIIVLPDVAPTRRTRAQQLIIINETLGRVVDSITRYLNVARAFEVEQPAYLFDGCSCRDAAIEFCRRVCGNGRVFVLHLVKPKICLSVAGEKNSAGKRIIWIGDVAYEVPASLKF